MSKRVDLRRRAVLHVEIESESLMALKIAAIREGKTLRSYLTSVVLSEWSEKHMGSMLRPFGASKASEPAPEYASVPEEVAQ